MHFSSYKRLVSGPINQDKWCDEPRQPSCGGLTYFVGTVRNEHEGRAVRAITYHAHVALAERTLAEIEQVAASRFGVSVRVLHAIGLLHVGDASVVVTVAAGHRAESFDACRWTIDAIKSSVPIWKEEHFADGEAVFQQGTSIKLVGDL